MDRREREGGGGHMCTYAHPASIPTSQASLRVRDPWVATSQRDRKRWVSGVGRSRARLLTRLA